MRTILLLLLSAGLVHSQPLLSTSYSKWAVNPFIYDTDATAYLGRMGGTSLAVSNAVDTFVKSLKSDGTWTNFSAFYPFLGSNGGSNAQNLVSSSYTITWHGTWTINGTNGIASGGADGTYGDTGWNPSTQSQTTNAGVFVYAASTNMGNCPAARSTVVGGYAGGNVFEIWHNTGLPYTAGINQAVNNYFLSYGAGFHSAIYFGRNDTAAAQHYDSNGDSPATTVTGTAPNVNLAIGGKYYAGDNSYYGYTGQIQFIGLGLGTLSLSQYQTLYSACVALNASVGR